MSSDAEDLLTRLIDNDRTKEKASRADNDSEQAESVRRLLLYEVLLEEYESHSPSPLDAATQSPPLDAATQPPLDVREVARIKEDGRKLRWYCEGITDKKQREDFESRFNGQLVARVCDLMYRAQKTTADREVARLRADYKKQYRAVGHTAELQQRVTEAVIDHITEEAQATHTASGRGTNGDGKPSTAAPSNGDANKNAAGASVADDDDNFIEGIVAENDSTRTTGDKAARLPEQLYGCTLRSALCLSGGGIRSATFNLGILQGLARHGLLEKFDYLSTVSGGGFIGSWLTAWMHRQGTQKVVDELSRPPASPLESDPKPVDHLRTYSNYLSPQPGLLSADTWTLAATMLRNLLLTWLVFVPVMMAALIVPRLWAAFVLRPTFLPPNAMLLSSVIGYVAGVWALVYVGTSLPSAGRHGEDSEHDPLEGSQRRFLVWCILPLMISAMAFVTYWARLNDPPGDHTWHEFVFFTEAITLSAWFITALYRFRHATFTGRWFLVRLLVATVFIVLAQFITGCLLWYGATTFMSGAEPHKRLYATLAVPMTLLVLAVGCALLAGFSSRFTKDDDREWWARGGAWVLIIVIVWSVAHLLVLFAPSLFESLGATVGSAWGRKELLWNDISWANWGQILGIVAGIISGAITLFGGFSAQTPANENEAKRAGIAGKLLGVLTSLLAPLFLGFVVMLLSLATNVLLTAVDPTLPRGHAALIEATPFRYLLVALGLLALISVVMGSLINTNAFSLHFMWRTRIIRAYLGASRAKRNPNPFTGFDTYDNIQMYELRRQPEGIECPPIERPSNGDTQRPAHVPTPRKLFHIINIALNLAGGDKLEWQDRKAESFTISPFHAGSYWLGYRRSCRYGGLNEGISLGTAVAISGAFVSPNMGYMMTSPVVRFLMTLFNVRFGWWLGNPGVAGSGMGFVQRTLTWFLRPFNYRGASPFELRGPLLPVRPIVEEALGMTNDQSPYVYLSDGGHFENLGLYEMVLRRCRFIVVSDATTDADYSFDSLAQSIRQIRVDLGVPIEVREMSIGRPVQNLKGKYCAVGRIRYSCVDRKASPPPPPAENPHDPNYTRALALYQMEQALHEKQRGMTDEDFDGILIYVKASMIGDEPRDVLNYGRSNGSFPQEVIVDQWFSEAQFESYRALGSHIIDAICGGEQSNQIGLAAFARRARAHNQMNFAAFKEQINYAAFEKQFAQEMKNWAPDSYKQKVRKYLDETLK